MMKIAHGAEAVLFKSEDASSVLKERLQKAYRLPQLDDSLRSFRTRREAKVLQKLGEMNFPAPHLKEFSDQRMSILMDFVPGEKLRDALKAGNDFQGLGLQMGEKIGRLHQQHIIHGDLTTSNMLVSGGASKAGEVTFIDFGLSFFSEKEEDQAVDLFLLERALESTHYELGPELFEKVLEGYRQGNPEAQKVLERMEKVRRRGRNKGKE